MLAALGWILFAFLAGAISGAALMWRWAIRVPPPPVFPQAAPEPPPPVVPMTYEPPEPEERAQILLNDAVKARMLEEFQEKDGVSRADAEKAVEALIEAIEARGADVAW